MGVGVDDAFTDDIAKVGIPSKRRDNEFQQYISNLSVRAWRSSGSLYVTTGDFADGNIEFCWHDYGPSNGKGILNAKGGTDEYDWGDSFSVGKPGYGCLQVHNYRNSQVVLSVSRTGANVITSSRTASLGIGNRTQQESGKKDDDWTLAGNGGNFTTSDLYVFVRQKAVTESAGYGPVFTVQPQTATIDMRRPYIISAFAPAACRYQWYVDGKPISGETGATLTVMLPNEGDTHAYRVVAYIDDDNYTVSETATITAVPAGTQVLIR